MRPRMGMRKTNDEIEERKKKWGQRNHRELQRRLILWSENAIKSEAF